MSKTKPSPVPAAAFTAAALFVPKQEGVVEISLDDALTRIKELRAQMAPLEAQEKNLLEVAKAMMNAKGETKHFTPSGISAIFSESQQSNINKELAKELLGPNWAKVESFKTVKKFTVK